jgi:hypothetical protein
MDIDIFEKCLQSALKLHEKQLEFESAPKQVIILGYAKE